MAISSTYFIHLDFFVVGKDLYCLPSNANPSQAMLTEGMKEDGNAWTRVVRNNNLHPAYQLNSRHVLFCYGLQVVKLNNVAYDISEEFMYWKALSTRVGKQNLFNEHGVLELECARVTNQICWPLYPACHKRLRSDMSPLSKKLICIHTGVSSGYSLHWQLLSHCKR